MRISAVPVTDICFDPIRTLLVVEDEDPVRDLISECLTDAGYRVLEASNVAQAKDTLFGNSSVELVFSDINMPGHEDGFALARWLREHHPEIKILLTSGVPQAIERTIGVAAPLVAKPYQFSLVLQRIESLIGTARPVATRLTAGH